MKLNAFQLKLIAMFLMLLDHLYTFIPGTFPIWFGYLGKLSAPIFFYFIVEGFFHTRNREKYMSRLFGFGIIMIFLGQLFNFSNNVFLSLGLAVCLMSILEYGKKNKRYALMVIGAIIVSCLMLVTEASIYGVWMTLVFYFFRDHVIMKSILYVLLSFLPVVSTLNYGLEAVFLWDYQWMMGFSIILILMYNGNQGMRNKFTKWMFYAFYPLHLVILSIINQSL